VDVGRIIGSFHFSTVPVKTLGLISPVSEEANFFLGGTGIGQCNVMYRMHVALQSGCSIPAAK